MKNGHGRFFHLDHGQLFEGFWVDDVAKCGTMIDFGRDEAPEPTRFPIPEVGTFPGPYSHTQRDRNQHPAPPSQGTDAVLFSGRASPARQLRPPISPNQPLAASFQVKLLDPDGVLKEALAMFQKSENEEGD